MTSGLPVCAQWVTDAGSQICVQWLGCPAAIGTVGEICETAYMGNVGLFSHLITRDDVSAIAPSVAIVIGLVWVFRLLSRHFGG